MLGGPLQYVVDVSPKLLCAYNHSHMSLSALWRALAAAAVAEPAVNDVNVALRQYRLTTL